LPFGTGTTAPRFARLKSSCCFIVVVSSRSSLAAGDSRLSRRSKSGTVRGSPESLSIEAVRKGFSAVVTGCLEPLAALMTHLISNALNALRMEVMTRVVEELYAKASELSPSDRAELAGLLLESIDEPPDEGVENAWAAEIERRMADYRAGRVKTISWSEVRARLHRSKR
jgi:putative addiction module component (TIGR02574 family)